MAGLTLAILIAPACDSSSEEAATAPRPSAPERKPPAPTASTERPSLTGCWNTVIELPWPAGDTPGELCLEEGEGRWTGKFFLEETWRPLADLQVRPDGLDFDVQTPMGTAKFDLRHDGTTLTGTADGAFGPRPFRATRK